MTAEAPFPCSIKRVKQRRPPTEEFSIRERKCKSNADQRIQAHSESAESAPRTDVILPLILIVLLLFLPNSVEFGWCIAIGNVQIPICYLAVICTIPLYTQHLVRGLLTLPEFGLLYVFIAVHELAIGDFWDGDVLLAIIKGFFPPLAVLVIVGARERIPSWEYLMRYGWFVLLMIVVYIIFYCFMPEWIAGVIPGWGEMRLSSGISGAMRASLPFGGPNLVGCFLAALFPVLLLNILENQPRAPRSLGNFCLAIVPMVLTFSKGTYLLVGAQSLLMLLKSRRKALAVLIVLFLVLGISISGLTESRVFAFREVDLSIAEHSGSTSLRAATYLAMWRHIVRDPMGTGLAKNFFRDKTINDDAHSENAVTLIDFDDAVVMFQSHSGALLWLVEFGWFGGLLVLWVCQRMFARLQLAQRIAVARRNGQQCRQFRAMRVALISLAGWTLISDAMFYNFRFAVLLWSVVGAYQALALRYIQSSSTKSRSVTIRSSRDPRPKRMVQRKGLHMGPRAA